MKKIETVVRRPTHDAPFLELGTLSTGLRAQCFQPMSLVATVGLAFVLALCPSLPNAVALAQPPTPASKALAIGEQPAAARPSLLVSVTIFVLAIFLGVELIRQVPATLHTPLMSGSNAISGITVVGALIAAGSSHGVGPAIAFLAIVLAMINVVGGFLVTDRMLRMFKRK